ncbi:MAG: LamG-like jellyroll fold domain-containing protein [Sandaracinaceae bacterium]
MHDAGFATTDAGAGGVDGGSEVAVLLLYSSLDDANAVTHPAVGTGVGATLSSTPGDDFAAGHVGGGILSDDPDDFARFAETDGVHANVELTRGTMELWFLPSYDHDDDQKYVLVATGSWPGPGIVTLVKQNGSNGNALELVFDELDAAGCAPAPPTCSRRENRVASSDYAWRAGEWVLIRFTWDWTVPDGTRNVHIYIDGAEVPLIAGLATTGPAVVPDERADDYVWIGNRAPSGGFRAGGVIDEVRVWDRPLAP